jgi:chloride channel protein, CIC family
MKSQGRGDFTAEPRLLSISILAIIIGIVCAFVARLLLWLIALFTNLFYFQEISLAERSPAEAIETLGWISIFIPVAGGLIIGLMARYGSERIRGHGIPEALEAILIGRSRMQPKVAVLKPLSSAISIGSGGPFGAEGPIIMTGGACGSIIAQMFHFTSAERKALLVAGAAGGMSATFATPVAAVLLAVELLLFEWKPRSLIPVALASASAMLIRPFVLDAGPLFLVTAHQAPLSLQAMLSSVVLGLVVGIVALGLTYAVYAAEDLFHRVPLHWMWWPAIGGLAVGLGGLVEPRALGVGYDIVRDLLQGNLALEALLLLVFIKGTIWATALGSGTSGGVLAPLLIMGGAAGALASPFLPGTDPALCALIGMGAIMGGTMRSPFTGAIFALELTQDINALPALLLATIVAYGFTVLLMKRSILTEKVARRGFHVSREYAVDPLELTAVESVMTSNVVVVPGAMPVRELLEQYFRGTAKHQAYPVVGADGNLLGIITRTNLLDEWILENLHKSGDDTYELIVAYDLVHREPIVAYPWESCRTAALRMAQYGVGRLLVVSPEDPQKLIGIISRSDLLKPRARQMEEEVQRERFIGAGPLTSESPNS